MELKVVFYILLAIGWLVSKALAARQKSSDGTSEKVPSPDSSMPAGSGELSGDWRKGSGKRNPMRSTRGNEIPRLKLKPQRQEMVSDPKDYFIEGGMQLPEIIAEDSFIQGASPLASDSLADEIRSGQIDWRRQVIFAELLTKRHV